MPPQGSTPPRRRPCGSSALLRLQIIAKARDLDDRPYHLSERPAEIRARRLFVWRIPLLRNAAAGAGAGAETGTDRYLGTAGHAGTDRNAPTANRPYESWEIRTGRAAILCGFGTS